MFQVVSEFQELAQGLFPEAVEFLRSPTAGQKVGEGCLLVPNQMLSVDVVNKMVEQRPLKRRRIGRVECERFIGNVGLDVVESEFRKIARDHVADGVVALASGVSSAFDDQVEANGLQYAIDGLGGRDKSGKVLIAEHQIRERLFGSTTRRRPPGRVTRNISTMAAFGSCM